MWSANPLYTRGSETIRSITGTPEKIVTHLMQENVIGGTIENSLSLGALGLLWRLLFPWHSEVKATDSEALIKSYLDELIEFEYVALKGDVYHVYENPIEYRRSLPYREYLKSRHWARTRECTLARANNRCQVCNTSSTDATLHVHHRSYSHIGNEMPGVDVIALCAGCHKLFHDNRKLVKDGK